MNLSVIFNAIVPDNIKDIELVKKCSNIFIEQLNRNSTISRRIADIFDVDKKTWLFQDSSGLVTEVSDSEMVSKSKDILKQGLFQVYLHVLYNLVEKIQTDPNVKQATDTRNYENSLIYKNIYDVLTSEYLGAFRYFQQNSGTKNAIKYIYQFAKYIETGVLNSDLTLDDTTGSFTLRYDGSLHKRYFSAFNQPMAHPCGWCYEYSTVMSMILEDYFGINISYNMPRGVSIKTNNGRYIIFTEKTNEEFYESLKNPMNVFSENALSEERIEYIKTLIISRDFKDLDLKNCDILILNKTFSKFQFLDELKKVVYFDDGTCLFFDNNLYYGFSKDIYEVDKMTLFPKTYHLNIGTDSQILETKSVEILYRDELGFESEVDLGFEKGAGYYRNSFENKFHLSGKEYPFVIGVDESRNKVINYSDCKNNLKCFDTKIDVVSNYLTYFSASDKIHKTSLISDNVKKYIFNTHGWYNNDLEFFASTGKDFYLKTNIINKKSSSLYIKDLNTSEEKISINGHSEYSGQWKISIENYPDITGTFESGDFNISIDTSAYKNNNYSLVLDNTKDSITVESNGLNCPGNFKFGFPTYEGKTVKPILQSCTSDTMLFVNEGEKILSEISLCDLPLLYTNSKLENYENKGNIAEPINYSELNSETWEGLTYIDEGFEFIKTDNSDCYVIDSSEYVDDEFECSVVGFGHYLTFFNDHDEGSDSQGKFLVNRNPKNPKAMLSGLVLTTS